MGIDAIIKNVLENISDEIIKDFVVLQIGANDGVQDDFIRDIIIKYNLETHLVEPLPEIYNELTQNYKDYNKVKTYNLAISNEDGEKEIFSLEYFNDLPVWCKGLSTFDISRNFLSGFGGLNRKIDMRSTELFEVIKNRIIKKMVKIQKLDSFLEKNNIKKIDIFVIDAEGHDYEIFKQIDFKKYEPKIIALEIHTLTDLEKNDILITLQEKKYNILENEWDLLACKS